MYTKGDVVYFINDTRIAEGIIYKIEEDNEDGIKLIITHGYRLTNIYPSFGIVSKKREDIVEPYICSLKQHYDNHIRLANIYKDKLKELGEKLNDKISKEHT